MKLHAGGLCGDWLVLYGEDDDQGKRIIRVPNKELQWDIYCNDVEFKPLNYIDAVVLFNGIRYVFEYSITRNPFQFLGFGE